MNFDEIYEKLEKCKGISDEELGFLIETLHKAENAIDEIPAIKVLNDTARLMREYIVRELIALENMQWHRNNPFN